MHSRRAALISVVLLLAPRPLLADADGGVASADAGPADAGTSADAGTKPAADAPTPWAIPQEAGCSVGAAAPPGAESALGVALLLGALRWRRRRS